MGGLPRGPGTSAERERRERGAGPAAVRRDDQAGPGRGGRTAGLGGSRGGWEPGNSQASGPSAATVGGGSFVCGRSNREEQLVNG